MKRRTTTFFMSLALMIVATLFIAARSEPVKSNGDPGANATVDPSQTAPATEPAAPSPKTNGLKKAAPPNRLSFGVDEVVKMFQGGVESDVILNYVENSSVPYHLSADEVVHLHDIGVPSPIITTLIRHGAKVQQQANAASALVQQKATEEAKAASAYINPYSAPVYAPPAPAVNYTYTYPSYENTAYPVYVYPRYYPYYYSYPGYCYSSPFYYRYNYPGYRHYYSYGGFRNYPHFSFGARFGHSPRIGIRARF